LHLEDGALTGEKKKLTTEAQRHRENKIEKCNSG
jgi:hypothetical protein